MHKRGRTEAKEGAEADLVLLEQHFAQRVRHVLAVIALGRTVRKDDAIAKVDKPKGNEEVRGGGNDRNRDGSPHTTQWSGTQRTGSEQTRPGD